MSNRPSINIIGQSKDPNHISIRSGQGKFTTNNNVRFTSDANSSNIRADQRQNQSGANPSYQGGYHQGGGQRDTRNVNTYTTYGSKPGQVGSGEFQNRNILAQGANRSSQNYYQTNRGARDVRVSGGNAGLSGIAGGVDRRTGAGSDRKSFENNDNFVSQRQVSQEVERPQYKKKYSNNYDGKGEDYRRSDKSSKGAQSEKKPFYCNPILLGILAFLVLAGLIVGILAAIGVIGGKGHNLSTAAGAGVGGNQSNTETEDGKTSGSSSSNGIAAGTGVGVGGASGNQSNTETEDGKTSGSSSSNSNIDANSGQITKDGQKYQLIGGGRYPVTTIDNKDYVTVNGQRYQVNNGSLVQAPQAAVSSNSGENVGDITPGYTIGKLGNGTNVANIDGKTYPIDDRNGNMIVNIDGKSELLRNGEKYPITQENGDAYVVINGNKQKLSRNDSSKEAINDGKKYEVIDGQKYPVTTVDNKDYITMNGHRYLVSTDGSISLVTENQTQ